MNLSVAHRLLPKRPSAHASLVMDHFGIDFETGPHVIADRLELPIEAGDVVCFTGASGSGKSSLMRAAAAQLEDVLDIDDLDLGDDILVDSLGLAATDSPIAPDSQSPALNEALALLSICGLGEARLLLRTPQELSDGQRYRFRLALALSRNPQWILADEFTATLDRILARVIAFNIHRTAARRGVGFLLATTHEDILEDLAPTLHVECRLDGRIKAHGLRPVGTHGAKKNKSASPPTSASPPPPSPTGRTSLGGITAATTSAASAT